MTLTEYKALRHGSLLKLVDDMEAAADLAYKTAIAGAYDKDGKPVIKKFTDLFDRKKVERALLADTDIGKRKASKEDVENFKRSKQLAEDIMNGITIGKEDD